MIIFSELEGMSRRMIKANLNAEVAEETLSQGNGYSS
jgi:hypothetical protein